VEAAELVSVGFVKLKLKGIRRFQLIYADWSFKIKPGSRIQGCVQTVGYMGGRLSTSQIGLVFYIIMNKACSMYKLYKWCNGISFFFCKGRGAAFSGCHFVAEH